MVFDVNVLVGAVAGGNSPFRSWPSPPPTSGNPYADCLGIIVDAAEFALWLSPHILGNTTRVLQEELKWEPTTADAYLDLLARVASNSGGGGVAHPSCALRNLPPKSTACAVTAAVQPANDAPH